MSHRLQVLISPELDAQLSKAAQRSRMSKGQWVRCVLQEALERKEKGKAHPNPLARLANLNGPAADIDQMLREIEAGRS